MQSRPFTQDIRRLPHCRLLPRYQDSDAALSELDGLIPQRRQQLRVRVQGRVAPVYSASVMNRRSAQIRPLLQYDDDARQDTGVSQPIRQRRNFIDRSNVEDEDEDAMVGDAQLRGYGIGGFGNIRTFGPLCGG
jgi:hypothetical protein